MYVNIVHIKQLLSFEDLPFLVLGCMGATCTITTTKRFYSETSLASESYSGCGANSQNTPKLMSMHALQIQQVLLQLGMPRR